jgi:hypothetical protein
VSDFKPTHRQKYADVEAHQLTFENLEEMGRFIGAEKIATSNPSGQGLVISFYLEGEAKRTAKLGWWILKNAEGGIAVMADTLFQEQFEKPKKSISWINSEESSDAHSLG